MDELAYYASPGPLTDAGAYADGLPKDAGALARIVQGLLVHPAHAWRYGVERRDTHESELQSRSARAMFARVTELDPAPPATARPPDRRLTGNCRHFSTLLCALLRSHGVPARARCGFATYFQSGKFVDHWVCEWWHSQDHRWVMTDAQIDDVQHTGLGLDFDPLDVPGDRFLVAGHAWRQCRAGKADPMLFGIFDMWGLWFVRGNVLRDLAALNKVELLPWDGWGLMLSGNDEHIELTDVAAAATLSGDLVTIRGLYESEDLLHAPDDLWRNT